MKKIKTLLMIFMMALIGLIIVGCGGGEPEPEPEPEIVAPTTLEIETYIYDGTEAEKYVLVGSKMYLGVIVDDGADDAVTWSIDGTTFATLEEDDNTAIITGVRGGVCKVTATSVSAPTLSATIDVEVVDTENFNEALVLAKQEIEAALPEYATTDFALPVLANAKVKTKYVSADGATWTDKFVHPYAGIFENNKSKTIAALEKLLSNSEAAKKALAASEAATPKKNEAEAASLQVSNSIIAESKLSKHPAAFEKVAEFVTIADKVKDHEKATSAVADHENAAKAIADSEAESAKKAAGEQYDETKILTSNQITAKQKQLLAEDVLAGYKAQILPEEEAAKIIADSKLLRYFEDLLNDEATMTMLKDEKLQAYLAGYEDPTSTTRVLGSYKTANLDATMANGSDTTKAGSLRVKADLEAMVLSAEKMEELRPIAALMNDILDDKAKAAQEANILAEDEITAINSAKAAIAAAADNDAVAAAIKAFNEGAAHPIAVQVEQCLDTIYIFSCQLTYHKVTLDFQLQVKVVSDAKNNTFEALKYAYNKIEESMSKLVEYDKDGKEQKLGAESEGASLDAATKLYKWALLGDFAAEEAGKDVKVTWEVVTSAAPISIKVNDENKTYLYYDKPLADTRVQVNAQLNCGENNSIVKLFFNVQGYTPSEVFDYFVSNNLVPKDGTECTSITLKIYNSDTTKKFKKVTVVWTVEDESICEYVEKSNFLKRVKKGSTVVHGVFYYNYNERKIMADKFDENGNLVKDELGNVVQEEQIQQTYDWKYEVDLNVTFK